MATSSDTTLPMNTLLHMLTIKLNSSNYLLWKNQVEPLLHHQDWYRFVNGSYTAPSKTTTVDAKEAPNPEYVSWLESDQRIRLLLQSSLTEEAMAEVLGLSSSREVWLALESAYSHDSMERSQNIKDALRQLKKGVLSVSDFAKKFKSLCDQLSAIGTPVSEDDKCHWFLCGLGPTFETFSTAHRAIQPRPLFRDLLAKAEGHELFITSLHGSNPAPSPAAFMAYQQQSRSQFRGGRGRSARGQSPRGGYSSRGRGRRSPHCQLCRNDGHYASSCPDLASYANKSSHSAANLAQAFHADCTLNDYTPDWNSDSGATLHMAPSPNDVDSSVPYRGNEKVYVGNGQGHQENTRKRNS
ncbi:putative RNA-directed DNA polymerase [Helianthus debilis subsp. tardiflorus]